MLLPLGIALWFLLRSMKPGMITYLISWIVLALTIYTYVPARMIVPLFGVVLLAMDIWSGAIPRRWILFGFLAFLLLLLPMARHWYASPEAFHLRFHQVSIFSQAAGSNNWLIPWVKNYLSHFTLSFLFITGDSNLRHSQLGIGELIWSQFPLLILGVFQILKGRWAMRSGMIWLLLLSPVPSALSADGNPHAMRSVAGLIPWLYITVAGMQWLIEKTGSIRAVRILLTLIIVFSALECAWIGYDLLFRYPLYSARAYEYGTREAIQASWQIRDAYDEIWFTKDAIGADRIIAYELDIDCSQFASYGLNKTKYRWIWVASSTDIIQSGDRQRKLLILRPEDPCATGRQVLPPVIRPDGTVAFVFIDDGPPNRIDR